MLSVKCFSKEQIQACKAIGVGAVYVCDEEIYLFAKEVGVDVFFCTPIMLKDFQIKRLEPFIDAYQPNILTISIGYAKYIAEKYRESLCDSVVRLDYLSNILNRYSFNMLNNEAIQSATVSLEHPGLINGIIRHHNNAEFPLFIHPIMMVTEFCPYKTETPCTVCRIDEGRLLSEDRETEITIKRDLFCRMQLVGQRPMDFSKGIQNAKNSGINKFRIDLLNQSKKETADIIQRYIGR